MDSLKLGGVALVALIALLVLRQLRPEWAPLLRLSTTVLLLGSILSMAALVLNYVGDLAEGTGALDGDGWTILLKTMGIGFLTETAASICRDSGEATLGSWVEMAGRLEILLLALPLIRTVLDTVAALLGGGA